MTDNDRQAANQPVGFWKIRHAVMGLGALLLVIVFVRSCDGDAEDEKLEADAGDAIPRTSVAVKIPAPQWQGQQPTVQQQARQTLARPPQQQPAYGYPTQQQQPAYGYPTQQQQPAYGYPTQQQQPAYGYPTQQQQPAYGYPTQQQPAYGYPAQQPQQQPQLPAADRGNPWAVQQPAYSYGSQPVPQRRQWGQARRPPPVDYSQPSAGSQYRPLDEKPHTAQKRRATPPPATGQPTAPYDRLSGSSFGDNTTSYPHAGSSPGYYGGTPYGVPAYGGGWPAGGGLGYPGAGWPGHW